MPKFIGRCIEGSKSLGVANYRPAETSTLVRLSYSQAVLLPAEQILYSLDTTDKGSKGTLAKRWYRWYAEAADILAATKSTRKMREAAAARIS